MITVKSLENRIEALDWDCIDADTQYLTHSIHRYSGKFIPQIAKQAIELLSVPGDLVLDPYCGSGTTILECSLTARRSIGMDLNPLAILIAKVKTSPISKKKLTEFSSSIESYVAPLLSQKQQPQFDLFSEPSACLDELVEEAHHDPRWTDEWYQKWFQDHVRLDLIILHRRIIQETDDECRNIGLTVFSDILRKCSNANPRYPNVMFDSRRGKAPGAAPEFVKRLGEVADAVSGLEESLLDKPLPRVVRGDARHIPLDSCSVDAIVTHPPYIGSIPYAEYGVLSLIWLGHDPRALDRRLTGGRRQSQNVINEFEVGFRAMIAESCRVLKPGGMLFMLLGNPLVKGKRVDLAQMAMEFASSTGLNLAAKHKRNGINRRANLMGHEVLLFFEKK